MKQTLEQPKFRKLSHGQCAGALILRTLWDQFDFSLLLTQSGIFKRSGAPSWMLYFMYVIGLVSGCTAVNQMAGLASKDVMLELMFKPYKLAQYTLSRFLTTPFAWRTFGKKRVERLQQDTNTALQEGDVINLDDTHSAHPYAPFSMLAERLLDENIQLVHESGLAASCVEEWPEIPAFLQRMA